MRRHLFLAASLVCTLTALADNVTIRPAGPAYFLDDIIEVSILATKRPDAYLSPQSAVTQTNFDVTTNTTDLGNRVEMRFQLIPRAVGPANFGGFVVNDNGQRPVLKVPLLKFVILDALDDGVSPGEAIIARQLQNHRLPFVIRPALSVEKPFVGQQFDVKWIAWAQERAGIEHFPRPGLSWMQNSVYWDTTTEKEKIDTAAGQLIRKWAVEKWIAKAPAAMEADVPSDWVLIRVPQTLLSSAGVHLIRRRAGPLHVSVQATPKGVPAGTPVGTFTIECPKAFGQGQDGVYAGVTIRGDSPVQTADLQFETKPAVPVFPARGYTNGASIALYLMSADGSRSSVPLPAFKIPYFDTATSSMKYLRCSASTLGVDLRTSMSGPKPAPPKDLSRMALAFQAIGILFVIVAIVGVARALQAA